MSNKKLTLWRFTAIAFLLEFPLILSFMWMMGDSTEPHFNTRQISEWLINYQGGFVRRGLMGEVLFRLANDGHLIQLVYATVFWSFFAYVCLFLVLYFKASIQNGRVLIAALVMQGGIFHMGAANNFYNRKEILFLVFFAILSILYLQIQASSTDSRKRWIAGFSLFLLTVSPLLVLIHEAYFFMGFPAAFLLLWIISRENAELTYLNKVLIFFGVEILLTFIMCTMNHGNFFISQEIWSSLPFSDRLFISPNAPYSANGPIESIGWTLGQHLTTIYAIFSSGGIFMWLLYFLGNGITLMYVYALVDPAQDNARPMKFTRFALVGILSSSSMFLVASDWGRWLGFLCSQTIMLLFILTKSRLARQQEDCDIFHWHHQLFQLLNRPWVFILILAYGLLLQMPECCVDFSHNLFPYDDYIGLLGKLFRGNS